MTKHLLIWISLILIVCLSPAAQADAGQIKVALFVGGGTEPSEFTKEFRNSNDPAIYCEKVDSNDIRNGVLTNFDALVIPGGSASVESRSLGKEARDNIRQFVSNGGIYLGVCAGAYLASQNEPTDLGFLPVVTADAKHWFRVDPDNGPLVDIELTPAGMEVFGINQSRIKLIYENGPIFAPPTQKPDDSFTPLAYFRSEVVADGGTPGVMINSPAIILARYGRGSVLSISPHPEETPGFKETELHAIHWLYNHRVPRAAATSLPPPNQPVRTQQQSQPKTQSQLSQQISLSDQAFKLADSIFDQASVVNYVHREVPASEQVTTGSDGTVKARTDCSGFISYVVHSIAPRHYQIIRSREPDWSYPQAKVWARYFATLDPDTPEDGWMRVGNWQDLRQGDIMAWQEGSSAGGNTGHVMMAAGRPSSIQQNYGHRYFEIPVIDSSSVYHFAPEYLPPSAHQRHRDGLGMGVVRIILSDNNVPIGYWAGTFWGEGDTPISGPKLSRVITFARMVSLEASN